MRFLRVQQRLDLESGRVFSISFPPVSFNRPGDRTYLLSASAPPAVDSIIELLTMLKLEYNLDKNC